LLGAGHLDEEDRVEVGGDERNNKWRMMTTWQSVAYLYSPAMVISG